MKSLWEPRPLKASGMPGADGGMRCRGRLIGEAELPFHPSWSGSAASTPAQPRALPPGAPLQALRHAGAMLLCSKHCLVPWPEF